MIYSEFDFDTWSQLSTPDHLIGGYPSIVLTLSDEKPGYLHVFKDGSGSFHLAIEVVGEEPSEIKNPKVNGLQVGLSAYRFHDGPTGKFIDIVCSSSGYLIEFTEIVKEIIDALLIEKKEPFDAVNQVVSSWKSFWSNQRKESLHEDEQLGLVCELIVLGKLCEIDPQRGLDAWVGPLGDKHDFHGSEWSFEVKGTRKSQRVHTINGLDQLVPPRGKKLAFISFLMTTSQNESAVNLPLLVENMNKQHFAKNAALHARFNELLSFAGYSPVHASEYAEFSLDIIDETLFEVDLNFPKLTSTMLEKSLDPRVSSIRYELSLSGMKGVPLNILNFELYLK